MAEPTYEQRLADAFERGREAGKQDLPVEDSPFSSGTPMHIEWFNGWHMGQMEENARKAGMVKK